MVLIAMSVPHRAIVAQDTSSSPFIDAPNAQGEIGITAIAAAKAAAGTRIRVLMIAAHPDDEDTRLITWLARGNRAKTAYLSLTRGDGGQNLIGNELGEALGVIRTRELLAARARDGAGQYFTRAFDFGFSKTAEETFKHWPRDSILGDMVKVVRAFRPHIIVSVFSGTPRDGHGHHQVAGILSREVFDVASDPDRFPPSSFGPVWTPLKLYASAWFRQEDATLSMNVGEYNPVYGRSYAEIAAMSRSQHKSQGFGTAINKGEVLDYLTRIASRVNEATSPEDEKSMFEGIDTTRIETLEDSLKIEVAQSNIAVEAFADREWVATGDSVPVNISVYRNGVLDSSESRQVFVRGGASYSSPYWLREPRQGDLFFASSGTITDDEREKQSWLVVPVTLPGRAQPVNIRAPVVHRSVDPVKGDVRRPLVTTPPFSVVVANPVQIVRAGVPVRRSFEVTVRSFVTYDSELTVRLELPEGLRADSQALKVVLPAGAIRTVNFTATGSLSPGDHFVRAFADAGSHTYSVGFTVIEYDHIPPQQMYRTADITLRSIDVKLPQDINVGYIQGVGDNVAEFLRQVDIPVTALKPEALPMTDLSVFSAIVVGPRAYQAHETLRNNNAYLLRYAQSGGNLVVQYGQYEMTQGSIMPFPITLSRPAARVTEEHSPVRIKESESPVLNIPNRITLDDFDNWVQERSLYMPSTADSRYKNVVSMNDTGEADNDFGILTTRLGKGKYTYTTLALFRQVPAGVSGGVRLFVNLLTPVQQQP